MNYKLAFIAALGDTARLWMCDARRGARSIVLSDYDATIKAMLGEGWEPFGLGTDGAVWFRKADLSANSTGDIGRPTAPSVTERQPEAAL
jgi:hypothetical protein